MSHRNQPNHPIIRTTTYTHPSPYAEHRTNSSTGADRGTTAPCRTGLARTGVLRLGNKFGSRLCSAVPIVCGCMLGLPRAAGDWLALGLGLEIWMDGGMGDCTTLSEGESESGGRGRNIRMGMLRKGSEGGGRRMLEMRWKEGRSTVTHYQLCTWSSLTLLSYTSVCRMTRDSLSSTAFHSPNESSFDRLIIPFAVPLRRKSASLTLLINASFITSPSESSRTSSSSGQSLKCTVRRQGSGFSEAPAPLEAGSAPAYRSYRRPTG